MSYQEQPRRSNSEAGFPAQEPTVTILFHGLQCSFFEGTSWCTVGLHNTTHTRPHPQPHDYVVKIWKKVNGACPAKPYKHLIIGDPKLVSKMHVTAEGVAEGFEGVHVYQRDPFNRPDPDNTNDPKDWRWAIDFDELYEEINIKPGTLDPGVIINNGLFYTLRKTRSKFRLHPVGQPDAEGNIVLGSVAEFLAANIYLKQPDGAGQPGGKVTLSGGKFHNTPEVLVAEPGITYQIDITNNCDNVAQNPPCKFMSAQGNPKEVRNDFYLYYKLFDPQPEPEYELIITERIEPLDEHLEQFGACGLPGARATDDAPCGGVGFGGGGG